MAKTNRRRRKYQAIEPHHFANALRTRRFTYSSMPNQSPPLLRGAKKKKKKLVISSRTQ
jgi:hypothetical protein